MTNDNAKTLTTTIKKLAAEKTYYVRIRTYTTVKKKNYYSTWFAAKTVKTKKTGKKTNESEKLAFEITMKVGEEIDLKTFAPGGQSSGGLDHQRRGYNRGVTGAPLDIDGISDDEIDIETDIELPGA